MDISPDWQEWLELLNSNRVEYVIVGGIAVGHHGWPRYTKDIDILIRADTGNVQRLLKALDEFGFGSLGLKAKDFIEPDQFVQLGYEPNRIDLLTSVSGLQWGEIEATKSSGKLGRVPTYFIGLKALLKVKRASGRLVDLGDVERLERAHGISRPEEPDTPR